MSKHIKPITLQSALGAQTSIDETIELIKQHPDSWAMFNEFPPERQKELLLFMTGQKGINVLYNVFFLKIFNPQTNPKRLEKLLSALLGKKVKIKTPLPREGTQLVEKGSFVVMDILVELDDGSIFNLEIQKIGYMFPGQRSSCYISDMIMRQYNYLRSEATEKHPFDYRNLKPVHLLVLMQSSSSEFKAVAPQYMHNRTTTYSSGAKVAELENITYISLDTFREVVQNNVDNELHAWLTFLCNDEPEAILKLITAYPEFISIYQEIAKFRTSPKEAISMFSEALLEMDRNLERYMIEEAQKELEEASQQLKEVRQRLDDTNRQLDDTTRQLDDTNSQLNKANLERVAAIEENKKLQTETDRLKSLLMQHNIPYDAV